MSRKTFAAESLENVAPLEFDLEGQTFRVPMKLPMGALELLGSVMLDDEGNRIYAVSRIIPTLLDCLAEELWEPPHTDNEGVLWPGRWVKVDDRQRFQALLRSPRINISGKTLGELAMWIAEETTGHPTDAPNP